MPYNITTWKTKRVENLKMPLDVLLKMPCIEVPLRYGGRVEANGPSEGFLLEGQLVASIVEIAVLESHGESSGYSWDALLDALRQTTGYFEAIQIWEGGDDITQLVVKDGDVQETKVDL